MRLTHLQFMIAASRHRGAPSGGSGSKDPLAAIVDHVKACPDTPESKLLAKIVEGMRLDTSSYSESDIYVLDSRSLALVNALNLGVLEGRHTSADLNAAMLVLTDTRPPAV